MEDAIYLSNLASKVYLIHRRDEFRAESTYVDDVRSKDNIELILNSNIVEINGEDNIKSITIKDNNGNTKVLDIDGLFIAVGQEPKNEIFKNVVDLNDKGYIITSDDVHTKTKGIYAAGDTRVKDLRQLTTAVGDGSVAAMAAIKEMNNIE